jgi:hypothetical protein
MYLYHQNICDATSSDNLTNATTTTVHVVTAVASCTLCVYTAFLVDFFGYSGTAMHLEQCLHREHHKHQQEGAGELGNR